MTTSVNRLAIALAAVAAAVWVEAPHGQTQRRASGRSPQQEEWRDYAGSSLGQKYSPLDQIDKSNVAKLEVAWRWASADSEIQRSSPVLRASRYEDTPLMVRGVLYTVTSLGVIAAIDPGTGRTLWTHDPESYKAGRPHSIGFAVRGLSYWSNGSVQRVLQSSTDGYLISLDAETGKPDPAFGVGGKVDLIEGMPNAVRATNYTGRRAVIAGDVAIVGSAILNALQDNRTLMPPGTVQAYDIKTGKKLWTFYLVPRKGEFGYDTWLNASADHSGNANAWAGLAYDPELDYIYVSSSAPGSDFYGGWRPGPNLFGDSMVCLEAKTGKRVWHYQVIHHDLWDYDLVTHPTLGDVTVGGRRVKAVMAVSKNGFVYVFDRKTGKPLWPIEERPVPQTTANNDEWTSPTQPFPTKPHPVDIQGSTDDNLVDLTPDLKRRALEQLQGIERGPVYTPPSDKGVVTVPGALGGANWGGAAFDPETGIYYIPTRTTIGISRAYVPGRQPVARADADAADSPAAAAGQGREGRSEAAAAGAAGRGATGRGAGGPNLNALLQIEGLPIIKPPYARVTAINMNTGDHLWVTPIGNGPRNHPLLKDLNLPPLGDPILGASPLVTKTLLFIAVTNTFVTGQPQPTAWAKWSDPGYERKLLYALDKQSGKVLHVFELGNLSASAPMTYMYGGKQYLVLATGNADQSELVAFRLP